MKAQKLISVVGLLSLACGSGGSGGSGAEPAAPPLFQVTTPTLPAALPIIIPSYTTPTPVRSGELAVAGHLEGQLRGIDVTGETTDNSGAFELWEDGGYLQMNIARPGDTGAGMMILGIMGPQLSSPLSGAHWSSSDAPSNDPLSGVFLTSCAGPTMGDWPWELEPVEYEMSAYDDPERPENVVVVVAAKFPLTEFERSSTRELLGTFRFERLD